MGITNLVILSLLGLRLLFMRKINTPFEKTLSNSILLVLVLGLLGSIFKQYEMIKLYPIIINVGLAILFLSSLRNDQTPIIEIIARMHEKDLPPQGIWYTRQVTKAWAIFFILNGGISLYTFLYCTLEVWTFYNAFLSYILIGLLMGGEFLIRLRFKKAWKTQ